MSGGERARLLGRWGERLVAEDLRARGWRVTAANYRCRFGEVDLIAEDGRYLVFVEVKLRGLLETRLQSLDLQTGRNRPVS